MLLWTIGDSQSNRHMWVSTTVDYTGSGVTHLRLSATLNYIQFLLWRLSRQCDIGTIYIRKRIGVHQCKVNYICETLHRDTCDLVLHGNVDLLIWSFMELRVSYMEWNNIVDISELTFLDYTTIIFLASVDWYLELILRQHVNDWFDNQRNTELLI